MLRFLLLAVSHVITLGVGFALGVYFLPILTAPDSPDQAKIEEMTRDSVYSAEFTRNLKGSDLLHWGEGSVGVSPTQIVHDGSLAPGPDYKLYLVTEFVENEDEFLPLKADAQLVGDVKTFGGFILDVPEDVDIENYTTVVIWCEAFSEFISAALYR